MPDLDTCSLALNDKAQKRNASGLISCARPAASLERIKIDLGLLCVIDDIAAIAIGYISRIGRFCQGKSEPRVPKICSFVVL